jgi:hypothetical protein
MVAPMVGLRASVCGGFGTRNRHTATKPVTVKDPADLMALCGPCHAEIHWRQPANDNQIQFSFDFPEEPEGEQPQED